MRFEEIVGAEEGSRGARLTKPARILIADDHALVREGLRTMLSGEEGLEVVGEAHDGQQALQACRDLHPDLILMDVRMPKMDGLRATRKIKEEMPHISVVMVTMHENPDYLLEAIRAGAAGYVLKDASGERLLGAVRRTLEGESPLDQELAMRLLMRLAREEEEASGEVTKEESGELDLDREGGEEPEAAGRLEGLTPREVEVLRLVSRGQTNPQIAQNLLISRGTAKIHVQHIISKLGVSDRTQAAVRAIEAGLLGAGTRR